MDPTGYRDWLELGRDYYNSARYRKAIDSYRRALDLRPDDTQLMIALGRAYEARRQYDDAREQYRRALEQEPELADAAVRSAECLRRSGQYRESLEFYDRALQLAPGDAIALAGWGEALRNLGRYEESLEAFDRAIQIRPAYTMPLRGKASSLNVLRRFDEALKLWDRALALDSSSLFAQNGRRYAEEELQRLKTREEGGEPEEPESTTPTLDQLGRDLTALAKAGALPPLIGREDELARLMRTLVRMNKANPMLLGEPGVGKTALVEGLAQRLHDGPVPPQLEGRRVVELAVSSLVAGTNYRGTFEKRIKALIEEVRQNPGVILFIDEIHTLVGAGRITGGALDGANILKPALARGEITVIGATTWAEYHKHLATDGALARRFQTIRVEEPGRDETLELIIRLAPRYAAHHRVRITDEALPSCVDLSGRFFPERKWPDRALDLLDESCARLALEGRRKLRARDVEEQVADLTGVPRERLVASERQLLRRLGRQLKERVQGQDEAMEGLLRAVRLSRAGLRDPGRPRGVFLFAGPTGVGKTETAKALAELLFPEGDALIRLDMGEFHGQHTAARLIGSPPGYVGYGEEGQLTGPLRRKPYAVVLLDEVDKAHPDVMSMFMSLFDEGRLRDSEGRTVDASHAWFVLTSNSLGGKRGLGFGGESSPQLRRRLEQQFRPELLNRMDQVVLFQALDEDALRRILRRRLSELAEGAVREGVQVRFGRAVENLVLAQPRDAALGARDLVRVADQVVGSALSEALLRYAGQEIELRASTRKGELVLEPRPETVKPEA